MHTRYQIGSRFGTCAQLLAMAQIGLPDFRQGQAARGALQQPHAQLHLQRRHPPRQARLGHTQGPTCSRKATAFDHLGKKQHVIQVLHGYLITVP